MTEIDDDVRAVEATLFAAGEPMSVDQIRAHVGIHVDVAAALAELRAIMAGAASSWWSVAGAGTSRPLPTSPISSGGRRTRRASSAGPP
jgi:chromosome segregation and condensation protein ScpB